MTIKENRRILMVERSQRSCKDECVLVCSEEQSGVSGLGIGRNIDECVRFFV